MPEDNNDPAREQFIAIRRAQILDGAAQVFAEKGYHNATNKDIAEAAGVAYGTLYNYFESKADLLIGILNRMDEMESREAQFEAGLQLDFRQAVVAFLQRHIAQYTPYMTLFRAILPEVIVNSELRQRYLQQNLLPTRQMIEMHLQARVERGELRPLDVGHAAQMLTTLMLGAMLLTVFDEANAEPGHDLDELADLLFNGMKPDTT